MIRTYHTGLKEFPEYMQFNIENDSHQTINSFIWSPDGELYLGQGDGCESRVETPWGNSELFQA